MLKGIYTAASGMNYLQLKQEVNANNLANVNTTGFKKDNVFRRLLKSKEDILRMNKTDFANLELVDEVHTDFKQGSFRVTDNPLDLAINGSGFFAVQTPNGIRYTRNGSFMLNQNRELITSNGYPVMGIGGPVVINGNDVFIGDDGSVLVDGNVVNVLSIIDFPKPYELVKLGDGLYNDPNNNGFNQTINNFKIRQGVLEESNVNIVNEMVALIETSREFEAGQRSIHIQDSTLDRAVNEVGRIQR